VLGQQAADLTQREAEVLEDDVLTDRRKTAAF